MATIFSIKDPNPGVWFKFDEDDPESGEIAIRAVNQAKRAEIQRKAVKSRVEYKHGQRFQYQDTDEELFSQLLWTYTIVDWNGLEDEDGKPIPCNDENKLFLMQNNVGFSQFVGACIEKMNELNEDRVKTVTADLSRGSQGSKKNRPAKDAKP